LDPTADEAPCIANHRAEDQTSKGYVSVDLSSCSLDLSICVSRRCLTDTRQSGIVAEIISTRLCQGSTRVGGVIHFLREFSCARDVDQILKKPRSYVEESCFLPRQGFVYLHGDKLNLFRGLKDDDVTNIQFLLVEIGPKVAPRTLMPE
jgi:hypothetical protein